MTIAVFLAVVAAVAAPLLTLRRVRTHDRRRDEWLWANAQPRLTAVTYVVTALLSIGGAVVCGLGAIAGYPFLWAPAALFVGMLASTVISSVVAFRMPRESQ